MVLLLVVGVFATAADSVSSEVSEETKASVEGVIYDVSNPNEIRNEVRTYVEKFVEKKGVPAEDITNVTEVNFEDLPKEVAIENVDNSNLAIYQVDYEEEGKEKNQIFVITYSVNELQAQGDLIIAHDKRQFLHFGMADERSDSGFLKTATGVEGSLDNGYVMMREGSITGISTSLDVAKADSEGEISIIIYKNGEAIRFSNTLDASSVETKKDYDVQSSEVVTFEAGDLISAYVEGQGDIAWESVITMVEITTTN